MGNITEISRRIKEYFSKIGLSQTEAAKKLGVQQAAVSNQLNGRSFGKNSAVKWNSVFGFRTNWLLTGEGPMFDHKDKTQDSYIPLIPEKLFRAPRINILEYVTKSPDITRLPPVPHFQKHDLFARCHCDSMAPKIQRGYLLALRKLDPDTPIINGEIYCVDTKSNGMFVRKVTDNGNTLTFAAENPEDFPNFDLPREEIITILRVVGILITNI